MKNEQKLSALISTAKTISEKAYNPYSRFAVGCVIVTTQGNLFTGCNVENASYGLTVCAERVAVFKAVSEEGPGMKIQKVVIYTPTGKPSAPCGACRQVLKEFGDDFEVISTCASGETLNKNISELLPFHFDKIDIDPHIES